MTYHSERSLHQHLTIAGTPFHVTSYTAFFSGNLAPYLLNGVSEIFRAIFTYERAIPSTPSPKKIVFALILCPLISCTGSDAAGVVDGSVQELYRWVREAALAISISLSYSIHDTRQASSLPSAGYSPSTDKSSPRRQKPAHKKS